MTHDDIILELVATQREALERIRRKIAASQLAEAWTCLVDEGALDPSFRDTFRHQPERSDHGVPDTPAHQSRAAS